MDFSHHRQSDTTCNGKSAGGVSDGGGRTSRPWRIPPPASPVQLQVRLAPHILSSSLQKHLLIEPTEFYSFFHSDIQDGLGRVLPPVPTVQEAHLEKSEIGLFLYKLSCKTQFGDLIQNDCCYSSHFDRCSLRALGQMLYQKPHRLHLSTPPAHAD